MILAEVKTKDGEKFIWKLFNCSFTQFTVMANKRYVAIGRVTEIDTDELIKIAAKKMFGE